MSDNIPDSYEVLGDSFESLDALELRLKSNSLHVLLIRQGKAPVATINVTYHVGSRNEAAGYTGSTHFLEHLMFRGSEKFNKQKGTSIWSVLQSQGAEMNATTYKDRTNYYETVPNDALDIAIAVEGDRMRTALLRDEDHAKEMTVVRNEYERGENDPQDALEKELWAHAYPAHPYHHPTIGWRSDIETVSTERLREFYNHFYWPNNATVTIVGNFDTRSVLESIERHFGRWSASPHTIDARVTEARPQEGARRFEISRAGPYTMCVLGYRSVHGLHDDTFALALINYALSAGASSILQAKFVDSGMVTSIGVRSHPFKDAGLFAVYASLNDDTDVNEFEQQLREVLDRMAIEGVSNEKLKRAKARARADYLLCRDGSNRVASELNEAIAIGDWKFYTEFGPKIESISAKRVQEVAAKYFDNSQSTFGVFVPSKKERVASVETCIGECVDECLLTHEEVCAYVERMYDTENEQMKQEETSQVEQMKQEQVVDENEQSQLYTEKKEVVEQSEQQCEDIFDALVDELSCSIESPIDIVDVSDDELFAQEDEQSDNNELIVEQDSLAQKQPIGEQIETIEKTEQEQIGDSAQQWSLASDIVEKSMFENKLLVLALPLDKNRIVSVCGSLMGGSLHHENPFVPILVAEILDKGTRKSDKHQLSNRLADIGASVDFSCGKYRVRFEARCLSEHVSLLVDTIAEQLREPAFDAEELKILKRKYVVAMQRAKQSVDAQASFALMRELYPRGHPLHAHTFDENIDFIKAVNVDALREFHASSYGLSQAFVTFAGDVEPNECAEHVERAFSEWKISPLQIDSVQVKPIEYTSEGSISVRLEDKTSTVLQIGQSLPIDREHADYDALAMATFILGGNFSARLMQTVRDKKGLTYGIGSSVRAGQDRIDAYFMVRGTFAPTLLDDGEKSTRQVIDQWITDKVSERELSDKKRTLVGSYKVSLESTRNVAEILLDNAERGKQVSYIDTHVEKIESLTLEQVNDAIDKYMNPSSFVIVKSGTFVEKQ